MCTIGGMVRRGEKNKVFGAKGKHGDTFSITNLTYIGMVLGAVTKTTYLRLMSTLRVSVFE